LLGRVTHSLYLEAKMRNHGFSISAVVACCLALSGCQRRSECTTLDILYFPALIDHPDLITVEETHNWMGLLEYKVCCVKGKTGTVTIKGPTGKTKTLECHSQGITEV
jgi:hypothetical protein